MTLNLTTIDCTQDNAEELFRELREKLSPRGDVVSEAGKQRTVELFGEPLSPQQVVEKICGDVQRRGLEAVLEYTAKLDRKEIDSKSIRVSPQELADAYEAADPAYLDTIRRIKANIVEFQSAVLPEDVQVVREEGAARVKLRQRYLPLKRIGICVPGGAAAYPSTLLMTAVPAQTAGVKEIAVVVPPTDFGGYNVDLLAACHEIGVSEVYRVGGAQGVAALAYGVEGIPRVDKIV
ncbi:MAG TPA: histidinol dehydrogenase, partial [Planctomycetaceae bacterium]|nr:histidinol dehydrogenase [Planctomycetaceae bacterium]